MAKLHLIILVIVGLCEMAVAQTPDAEFDILEELPLTTPVANIADVPNLFPELTDQQRSSLQFGILNQASSPASLFNVSRTGGVIYIAKRVDREAFCLVEEKCILKINVLASSQIPAQFDSRVITIYFKVEDINDNAPTFDRDYVVLEITERNSLDSVLKITGANDRDFKPEFKVKNYTLNDFQDIFALTASQTLDGSSEIDLRLKQSLDREKQAKYEFTITAYDGGAPPKSSVLTVTVEVTDLNDNEPVFLNDTYSVTIDGKVNLNSVIVQVSATDADAGDNAEISYDFSNIQKPMLENTFRINSTSGEISVVGILKPGVTEFIVEAQDGGSSPLKTQTSVRVNVINSGNTPPHVSITTVGAQSQQNLVSILEPAGSGLFVAFVVVDDDSDDDITCEINNGVFRMEPIPNKGYKIVLQGTVDRETRDSYNLTVVCVDKGDPPLNSSAQFMVQIEDANDNAPEFTQNRYSRTIREGKKNGEFVLQVSASDKDIGPNGAVRYSIDSQYLSYFSIDRLTGVISAIGNLDRETSPVMTFNVYATDNSAQQKKQSSAEVNIVLEDINDNSPAFDRKVFRIKTQEEVEGMRIIEDLVAHDADQGVNSQIEFFFTGSLDGADGAFTVLQNGSIMSSTKLDREERVNYSFSVMVRDKGNPPLMSSASVVVEVTDINDNSPAILFPKSQNHTVLISTVPETGVVLSRIIAYDDDAGDNGSLKFTIVSGNDDRAFEVGESSGELKIAEASRLKNRKKYTVGIVVADRGLPPKFNQTSLKIDVQYENITKDTAKGDKEKQEDYIIIVAVVAAVTVIFSTLIIVAICVVFQKDRSTRQKQSPKGVFHGINPPENLSDDEKVNTVTQDCPVIDSNQQYTMNNLSSPPGGDNKSKKSSNDDGTFFQVKLGNPDAQSQFKGKAVSFSLDEKEMISCSTPRHSSPRDETPPLPTFGSSRGRTCDDDMFHQRSTMTRQGDDVTSDTSGDTTTCDSGRGTSIDDVNFDHSFKGDVSPQLSSRRHSDDLNIPPRKNKTSENNGRSSYHVRFAQNPEKSFPPDLPPKQKMSNQYNGARPFYNPQQTSYKDSNSAFNNFNKNMNSSSSKNNHVNNSRVPKLSTFGTPRQMSVTSMEDDATTTTSGSYVINPDDIRIDTFVGSDIIV